MRFKKAFTLIEVVVVIGIIGILTVIIFPAINNIRAKNRDTERVADIATIQLGLSLYYNHLGEYPPDLQTLVTLKYVPADAIVGPTSDTEYTYVPLTRDAGGLPKCTYYHLGVILELQSGQIDMADNFNSNLDPATGRTISGEYYWCGYSGPGLSPPDSTHYHYNVHP